MALVIVEVMGKVGFEARIVRGVVPTEQRAAGAKQLVGIASVTRIVVEPDLKSQRWGERRPHFDPESIAPVDF